MFDQISREAASETTAFLMRTPPAAEALDVIARADTAATPQTERVRRFEAMLRANPRFTWVSCAATDGTFTGVHRKTDGTLEVNVSKIADGTTTREESTIAPDGTWVGTKQTLDTKYDPRTRPFYTLAAAATHGVWTPPYVFEGDNVPGITFALPNAHPTLAGVFTIDFDLARLSELTRELRVSQHGKVVMVSDDDVVLEHPSAAVVRAAPLASRSSSYTSPSWTTRRCGPCARPVRTRRRSSSTVNRTSRARSRSRSPAARRGRCSRTRRSPTSPPACAAACCSRC